MQPVWELFRRRPIFAMALPVVVALGVQAMIKVPSDWLDPFVLAARIFLGGGDIYQGTSYLYPPVMALVTVPFTPLPDAVSRLAWYAINIACIVGMLRSSWLLARGGKLQPIGVENRREWVVAGIGIACTASYVLNTLAHQQIDLIIDFLLIAGCLLLVRGGTIGGAVLIGLGAACKGPPLLFAPYLVFRRKWLSAGLVAVVGVGANLLPDFVVPPPGGQPRLLEWLQRLALPTFNGAIGAWNGVTTANQSLAGTVKRLFTTALRSQPSDLAVIDSLHHPSELLIKATAYGIMLALLVASVIVALRAQSVVRTQAQNQELPSQTALELGMMATLVLLMSPMSSLAHLGALILPAFCLSRIAVLTSDRLIAAALVVAAVGALCVNKDLVGGRAFTLLLWLGIATLSMLAVWAGCAIALARGRVGAPVAGFSESIFVFSRRGLAAELGR